MASKITSHNRESRRAATHKAATHIATTQRSSYRWARQNPAAARKSMIDGRRATAITSVPVCYCGVSFPGLRMQRASNRGAKDITRLPVQSCPLPSCFPGAPFAIRKGARNLMPPGYAGTNASQRLITSVYPTPAILRALCHCPSSPSWATQCSM